MYIFISKFRYKTNCFFMFSSIRNVLHEKYSPISKQQSIFLYRTLGLNRRSSNRVDRKSILSADKTVIFENPVFFVA